MEIRERRADVGVGKQPLPRSLVSSIPNNGTLIARASDWFCPWTRDTFPGFRKHILSLLPRSYVWGSVQNWRAGRAKLPPPVARALSEEIRRRCAVGLEIAADLDAAADAEDARVKPLQGFFRVEKEPFRR